MTWGGHCNHKGLLNEDKGGRKSPGCNMRDMRSAFAGFEEGRGPGA